MWIKNTNKKPDAMLTFATLSFGVVTLNMLLSSFESFSYGDVSVMFKSLDGSVMAVYLGATFTAYVSRRWTDKKYGKEESSPIAEIVNSIVDEVAPPTPEPPADVALSMIEMEENNGDTQPIKKRRSKRDPS
jgi:hypothetical protein